MLSEIEIILFDGQVVNYSEKIRKIREKIVSLEAQKVILNEDLIFSSDKKKLIGSSKDEIKKEIKEIDRVIKNVKCSWYQSYKRTNSCNDNSC